MTKRFLISVAAATLIAGTGFANAQGTGMGRESPSGGGATQQGGATDQKSDMKSEQKSTGAEKSQRTEDQMKGGKDWRDFGRKSPPPGTRFKGKEPWDFGRGPGKGPGKSPDYRRPGGGGPSDIDRRLDHIIRELDAIRRDARRR